MRDWKPLAGVLLDKSARVDERDDAAMDLGFHRNHDVLAFLIEIAKNPQEDEMVLASCGESIAEIILSLGLPHDMVDDLQGVAKREAQSRLRNPWISDETYRGVL